MEISMKIIDKYIIREFAPQFFLGFMVFSFILLMEKIFYLTDLILTKGVSFINVVKIFLYITPSFLSFTFPMAFLMGTLLTFGRLQDDNEITALKAGGVSQLKIIKPLLIISILAAIFTIYFNQFIVPNSQKKFTYLYYDIAYQSPTLKFEENTFFNIKDYKFYIRKIDNKKNTMKDILIYKMEEDANFPILITAKNGDIKQNDETLMLNLYNGSMQQKDDKNTAKFTQMFFKKYSLDFDMKEAEGKLHDYAKSIMNLTGPEIKREIKNLKEHNIDTKIFDIQYHQRISLAIACFVFVFLGASLSISSNKHTKSIAFGLSLLVIVVYYIILTIGISLAEKNILQPFFALNLPNIVLGGLGLFLISNVNRR
jgi:lipopolysaccharide export system permease protein